MKTLNDIEVGEKAVVAYVNTTMDNQEYTHRVLTMGIVPGVILEKVSDVQTCAEFILFNNRIVIDKNAADNIMVVRC